MFYAFELDQIPTILQYYTVTRNTLWQINSKENILIIIKKGRCSFSYDGEEFVAKKGDIIFIPANHPYVRRPVEKAMCTMTYVHFIFNKEPEMLDAAGLSERLSLIKIQIDNEILSESDNFTCLKSIYLQNCNHTSDFEKISNILNDINLFSSEREIMCYFQSSVALCSILNHLSQEAISSLNNKYTLKHTATFPSNLKKAIGYIRRNYSQPISLDDLANCCNVSKQQVIRYFREAFGNTPINYVLEYKISKAKELLFYQPHLTIKEISGELGFDNQHYFTRMFKKFTDETPSHYKNRLQNYIPKSK